MKNQKVIIEGSRVRRLDEQTSGIRQFLTLRNLVGFAGIVAFVVWVIGMIAGGG